MTVEEVEGEIVDLSEVDGLEDGREVPGIVHACNQDEIAVILAGLRRERHGTLLTYTSSRELGGKGGVEELENKLQAVQNQTQNEIGPVWGTGT